MSAAGPDTSMGMVAVASGLTEGWQRLLLIACHTLQEIWQGRGDLGDRHRGWNELMPSWNLISNGNRRGSHRLVDQ